MSREVNRSLSQEIGTQNMSHRRTVQELTNVNETSSFITPYAVPVLNPYQFENYGASGNYPYNFPGYAIVPNMRPSNESMPSYMGLYPGNYDMTASRGTAEGSRRASQQPDSVRFWHNSPFLYPGNLDGSYHGLDYSKWQNSPATHCFWRGALEYCGRYVCYALAISVTRGLYYYLPQAVNCYSRAEFSFLRDLCFSRMRYDVFFFLPHSKQDFPGYTSFLQFLSEENCAMVAKIGTDKQIYIVPPSHFSASFLNAADPYLLYGVVFIDAEASTSFSTAADSNYANLYQSYPQGSDPNYSPLSADLQLRRVSSDAPQENIQPDAARGKAVLVETGASEYPPSTYMTYAPTNSIFPPVSGTAADGYSQQGPFARIMQGDNPTVSVVPSGVPSYQSQQTENNINQFVQNIFAPVAFSPSTSQYLRINTSAAVSVTDNSAEAKPVVSLPLNLFTEPLYPNILPPFVPSPPMLRYKVQSEVKEESTTPAPIDAAANSPDSPPAMSLPTEVQSEVKEEPQQDISQAGETSQTAPAFSADWNERCQRILAMGAKLLKQLKEADAYKSTDQNGDKQ